MKKVTDYSLILFMTGILFVIFPTTVSATYWYVDNAATCTTCNGESWSTAWKSFTSIGWSSIAPGDTLYISGGSSGKTYKEALVVGASGENDSFITIDVGANSPSPSGHNGTVIIDGGGSRSYGIYVSYRSYVQFNGRSGTSYKLQVQNTVDDRTGAIHLSHASYTYVDYIKVNHPTDRGVFFDSTNNSRLLGCDMRTGIVNNAYETDGIYVQYGNNNLFDGNTVVLANDGTEGHSDAFQNANSEARLVVRNNYLGYMAEHGNGSSQGIMSAHATDYAYFYNNVIVGSSKQPYQVVLLYSNNATGKWFFWNNTIVAQHPNGHALVTMESNIVDKIGGIINNNIYTQGGYAFESETGNLSIPEGIFDYNNLYRSDGGPVTNVTGINENGISKNPNWNIDNEFRLNSESPCIDKGTNLSTYFTTDREGVIRPQGTAWDIGAYEFSNQSPILDPTPTPTSSLNTPGVTSTPMPTLTFTPMPTPTPTLILGDLNGDGVVTLFDVVLEVDIIFGNAQIGDGKVHAYANPDIDGNGSLALADALKMINIIIYS